MQKRFANGQEVKILGQPTSSDRLRVNPIPPGGGGGRMDVRANFE